MKFNIKWFEIHPMIKASGSIKELVEPFLQKNQLVHFSYVRRYADGTNFTLTTHPEMAIDFHRYALYSTGDFSEDLLSPESSALLWHATSEHSQKLFRYAREAHHLANGIVIIDRYPHYEEQFYFAADPEYVGANNFYLNNLELLRNFNANFLENVMDLIDTCDKNRLPMYFEGAETKIIKPVELTPREAEILYWLALGYSYKSIANKLGIKVKTVYFYLDNLKQKTTLYNRDALVEYYRTIIQHP